MARTVRFSLPFPSLFDVWSKPASSAPHPTGVIKAGSACGLLNCDRTQHDDFVKAVQKYDAQGEEVVLFSTESEVSLDKHFLSPLEITTRCRLSLMFLAYHVVVPS